MLLAAVHLCLEPEFLQARLDRFRELSHRVAPVAARALERLLEHPETRRVQVAKAQVLELVVDGIEAEAVGDRRVDVERLARDPLLLLRVHGFQRAHVVQAVGQLDEDDAHVAGHREEHLPEVLRLRVLEGRELDALDLRHTVDQVRHGLAEALGDLGLRGVRVLHHVVKQRRHERLRVEVPLREDLRHRERVRDVGLAALAELPGMRGAGRLVGPLDLRDVLGLEVAQGRRKARRRRVPASPSRSP